jgi:hypothetical protein
MNMIKHGLSKMIIRRGSRLWTFSG